MRAKRKIKIICHKSLYSSIYQVWYLLVSQMHLLVLVPFLSSRSLGMISLHYASCLPHFVSRFGCCFRCPSAFLLLMGFVGRLPRVPAHRQTHPQSESKTRISGSTNTRKTCCRRAGEAEDGAAAGTGAGAPKSSSRERGTNRLFSGRRILF